MSEQRQCDLCKTLVKILSWDLPYPAIILEEDGDISLDWVGVASVSINSRGGISWAVMGKGHGTDIEGLKQVLVVTLR